MLVGVFAASAVSATSAQADAVTVRYFRQLAYNHVSPHLPLRGVHEIPADVAAQAVHYEFRYDGQGRIVEIVNRNPEAWKRHPLTSLIAPKVEISYAGATETRRFLDKEGKPTKGAREVFQEVYEYAPDGFKRSLAFLDTDGKPMPSNWQVARYEWEKRGDLVVERRYDMAGKLVPISPYFAFLVTGIKYGPDGFPLANYNLDPETLEIVNNALGIASYNDKYDEKGNHLQFSYHDKTGAPTKSPWPYAKGLKFYDENGNVVRIENVRLDGSTVEYENYTYDAAGQLLKKEGRRM